jgi:hypothetical protein
MVNGAPPLVSNVEIQAETVRGQPCVTLTQESLEDNREVYCGP